MSQPRILANDQDAVNLAKMVAARPDLLRGVSNDGFDEAYSNPVRAMQFCIDFLYHYIIFSQNLRAFPSCRDEIDMVKIQEALEFIADFTGYVLTISDAPQESLDELLPGTKFNLRVNPNEPMDKWWFVDGSLKYLIKFAPSARV
jgi:hypothetical protein